MYRLGLHIIKIWKTIIFSATEWINTSCPPPAQDELKVTPDIQQDITMGAALCLRREQTKTHFVLLCTYVCTPTVKKWPYGLIIVCTGGWEITGINLQLVSVDSVSMQS